MIRWRATCALALTGDGQPCSAAIFERLLAPLVEINTQPDADDSLNRMWDSWWAINFLAPDQYLSAMLTYLRELVGPDWVYEVAQRLLNHVFVRTHYNTTRQATYTYAGNFRCEHSAFSHQDYAQAFARGAAHPTPSQSMVVREVRAAFAHHRIQTNLLEFCGLDRLE